MIKRKIYVVGSSTDYANWMEGELVRNMEDADLVVLTGGEDVTPELYGKKKHPTTGNNPRRDAFEVKEFNRAREMNKAIVGICRGSQLVCALSGGILVQDQQHNYLHDVTTSDGRIIRVTSSHHQRQYIQGLGEDEVELIAWAEHLSPYAFGESFDDKLDEDKEVEIAYYKKTKALGCQSHPEWSYPCDEEWQFTYIAYMRELLDKYCS